MKDESVDMVVGAAAGFIGVALFAAAALRLFAPQATIVISSHSLVAVEPRVRSVAPILRHISTEAKVRPFAKDRKRAAPPYHPPVSSHASASWQRELPRRLSPVGARSGPAARIAVLAAHAATPPAQSVALVSRQRQPSVRKAQFTLPEPPIGYKPQAALAVVSAVLVLPPETFESLPDYSPRRRHHW